MTDRLLSCIGRALKTPSRKLRTSMENIATLSLTQILNPELLEQDAVLSGYVSEVNGIDAKFAFYETAEYASAYFVDHGILYSISAGGFAEEDKIDPVEYLKGPIDTFQRCDIP